MPDGKSKILIVDDTPKNIQVVASVLQSQGHQLAFATDGYKALNAIEKTKFDLILLDVMMPGIDGYDTCKRLKLMANGEHVPVIFLTAKTDEESIVSGFDCGGVDYVTKPFNQRELLARVETHLKLKGYEDNLQKKVMRQTLNVCLEYLELSGKIFIGEQGVEWTFDENRKLKIQLRKAAESFI